MTNPIFILWKSCKVLICIIKIFKGGAGTQCTLVIILNSWRSNQIISQSEMFFAGGKFEKKLVFLCGCYAILFKLNVINFFCKSSKTDFSCLLYFKYWGLVYAFAEAWLNTPNHSIRMELLLLLNKKLIPEWPRKLILVLPKKHMADIKTKVFTKCCKDCFIF